MKGKKQEEKKDDQEPDYEKLYYQAMQENLLIKEKKVAVELTADEIYLLRNVMFEELHDLKYDLSSISFEDEENENEINKLKNIPKKDDLLNAIIDEKRLLLETIIKKLRFEI